MNCKVGRLYLLDDDYLNTKVGLAVNYFVDFTVRDVNHYTCDLISIVLFII